MLTNLFLLGQAAVEEIEEPSPIFNLRNGILALAIIAILIGYKIYKDKTMT